ncbi:hypothetical protein [Paractinoplanes hotanensis]|uniref:Secreted protein n=1 Tax=Paractinoplanes hotanensis TaxID=2906497 RepID=A0ABT0XWT7_9ACTN|nr:hypothetical protein [Actinoplanes hotanensis]MCM4078251.1 hypothetical protein [Actinoplanes hotanensis]
MTPITTTAIRRRLRLLPTLAFTPVLRWSIAVHSVPDHQAVTHGLYLRSTAADRGGRTHRALHRCGSASARRPTRSKPSPGSPSSHCR